MRKLFVTIMMAVGLGFGGCSLFEEGDDPREAAMSYFKEYVAAGNFSDAIEVAEKDRLYTTDTLRQMYRRWERGVARGNVRYGDNGAYVEAELARAGEQLRLASPRYRAHATKAFDEYLRGGDFRKADEVWHEFNLDYRRHQEVIVQYYSRIRGWSDFSGRHVLDSATALMAYDAAMSVGNCEQATQLAHQETIGDERYRRARACELRAAFGHRIQWKNYEDALQIAANEEAAIELSRVQPAAELVWQSKMENRRYVEAYRVALRWQLGADRVNRARREAFAYARLTGAYQLADRLPDGTIMILRDGT